MNLPHRFGSIRGMMQNTKLIDYIEALVGKIQVFGVANCEFALNAVHVEPATREFDASRREINSRYACPATRELKQICARSKTNFKQTLSRVSVEADRLLDPGRVFVTIAFNCIEVFARAELAIACDVGSAGIRAPLLARAPLRKN